MLKNKNVILTGAGRGIGRIIACKFAKEGASLALLSRTRDELEETFELIKSDSPSSFINPVDISVESQVKNVFSLIQSRFKTIDVLINNAGVQHPIGKFHENDFLVWKENIVTNLFGAALLTHHVLPEMIKNKKGKIINMSGGGSTNPRPYFSAYAVSKTAIVRFTENLAMEYKDDHIDINVVAPGAINTRMLEEVLAVGGLAGPESLDALKRKEQGGNNPDTAAELFAFLSSDESDKITGKLISAPWDPWKEQEFQQELKTNKDLGTLRRIDNKTFFKTI